MAKIWSVPFANAGDKESIPVPAEPDGSVSATQGWTADYELPNTDPSYKPVGREEMNGVLYEVTDSIRQLQQQGAAEWSADLAPYPNGAEVIHAGQRWISNVAGNTATPGVGASWSNTSGFVRSDGTVPFTAPQPGVAATASAHLTTRGQVEGSLTAYRANGFINNASDYAGSAPMGNVIGRLAMTDSSAAAINGYTVGYAGNITNSATPWSSGMGTLIAYTPSGSQGLRVDRSRYVDRDTCVHAGATVEYADVGNAPNTTKTTDLPDGFFMTGLRCGNGSVASGSVMVSLWPRGKQAYYGRA